MSETLSHRIAAEIRAILQPLAAAAESPFWLSRLFGQMGMDPEDESLDSLVPALAAAVQVSDEIAALAENPDPSLAEIARLVDGAGGAFSAIRGMTAAGGVATGLTGLSQDLIEFLVWQRLAGRYPLLFHVGVLLTLIEPAESAAPTVPVVDGEVVRRAPVVFPRFHLERLTSLLRDPVGLLRSAYVNDLTTVDDANAMADKLFPRMAAVLKSLDLHCLYGIREPSRELLGPAAALVDHSLLIYLLSEHAGADEDAGVSLSLSPADRGDLGLVVSPFGALTYSRQAGNWTIDAGCTAEIDAFAVGRHGLTLAARGSAMRVDARVEAALAAPDGGTPLVLGAPTGSRLELGSALLVLETSLSEAAQTLTLGADVSAAALVIAPGDVDSFLASVLPAEGLRVDFDLGVAWSSDRGWTLHGSAGLEAAIPVDRGVAGITLSTLYLSLQAQDDRLLAEVSASMGASIGPVQVAVDRMGLRAALAFPEGGGNIGVADLDFGFKPPSGLGLAIDASSVIGGGYLFFDPAKGEYAGVLQLAIAGTINVKAFGLLSTRLPDNAKGYSLIVFITAEDFQPIQLGMGFKLLGIGGMLAINRTFDEAALREGLKNDTLGTLLFPQDPIHNAPAILRNLATVFPAQLGSYLFGPLAKIGWATPTLIQMELALILQIGARRRLLVLGRISSILPSREKDLIRLNMDAMGVLDFDVGTITMDAVLVDSRLLQKFVLTGSMAMRACVVPGRAAFALAVGGMNPHFAPPASMPKLDRITINLTSGNNPRFTCDAYFAVTANTIQFGSRSTLYAAAYGFSVEGDVGFDVLVQLLPFHFLADFYASIQLKRGSSNLFKVNVTGALEGPLPLRVKAKASFEILLCDFSVHFDKTLIGGERPAPPPAVNALEELKRALGAPDSWNADLPAARHGVVMRKLPADAPLALDPLGQLTVKQSVLPLNTSRDLDVFGGAPLSGARRFTITVASLNTATSSIPITPSVQPARDWFAPAQFFELSDEDKLASPSFEEMDSGIVFGSDTIVFDESPAQRVYAPLKYDTITIDEAGQESPPQPYELGAHRLHQQLRFAAVAKAAARNTGLARFRHPGAAAPVSLASPHWLIASTTDLNVLAPDTGPGMSWGDARAALQELRRSQPQDDTRWQLVPAYEVTR
jgi:hypothetical protein